MTTKLTTEDYIIKEKELFANYIKRGRRCTNKIGAFRAYCQYLKKCKKAGGRISLISFIEKEKIPAFGYASAKTALNTGRYLYDKLVTKLGGPGFLECVPSWKDTCKSDPTPSIHPQERYKSNQPDSDLIKALNRLAASFERIASVKEETLRLNKEAINDQI